jgi:hypothetical protein
VSAAEDQAAVDEVLNGNILAFRVAGTSLAGSAAEPGLPFLSRSGPGGRDDPGGVFADLSLAQAMAEGVSFLKLAFCSGYESVSIRTAADAPRDPCPLTTPCHQATVDLGPVHLKKQTGRAQCGGRLTLSLRSIGKF